MNERLKEIEKEALASLVHKPFSMEQFREKFAELIVRECASIAGMNDDDTLSEGDIRARSIKRQIKEHFGVE